MNPMNQMNPMNPMNNNILNNNIQNNFSCFGIPQNQQNIMTEYYVKFRNSNGSNIICKVPADNSVKDMIQIYQNKASIEPTNYAFIYNSQKIDINSQMKIKNLFNIDDPNPLIYLFENSPPSTKITFDSSSGIKTNVKYQGCLCCSPFWALLKVYLHEIGLDENCLKDLQFIFNGKSLPNDKDEAMKHYSAEYGIKNDSIITVVDSKNLIGEKMNNK